MIPSAVENLSARSRCNDWKTVPAIPVVTVAQPAIANLVHRFHSLFELFEQNVFRKLPSDSNVADWRHASAILVHVSRTLTRALATNIYNPVISIESFLRTLSSTRTRPALLDFLTPVNVTPVNVLQK